MASWTRLDNAAKIFPSVTNSRLTHLFRLAVRLTDAIRPEILQKAVETTLQKFPTFRVRLKPGFFWFSLVDEPSVPEITRDSASPCLPFRRQSRGPHLFRVRYHGHRIGVEFSHALTDGMGGLVFLRSLTAEYLALTGVSAEDSEDLRRLRTPAAPDEGEDRFPSLFEPGFPQYETWDRAFVPPWPLLPKGRYGVTTGLLDVAEVLQRAKSQGATLTEFLAATLLASIQDTFLELPAKTRRRLAGPIRVVLPVNLRTVFPSKTLRNFFVVVPVEIDLRLGTYEFEEIVRKVHHQLQGEMDRRLLKKQIMRNLRGELNPLARILPLPLKNLVLTSVYGSYERRHTASLSNLGRTGWPGPWAEHIEGMDFTPPPSPFCHVNVGVVTCDHQLSLTFGNLSTQTEVERAFFGRLRRLGLGVRISSNRTAWKE